MDLSQTDPPAIDFVAEDLVYIMHNAIIEETDKEDKKKPAGVLDLSVDSSEDSDSDSSSDSGVEIISVKKKIDVIEIDSSTDEGVINENEENSSLPRKKMKRKLRRKIPKPKPDQADEMQIDDNEVIVKVPKEEVMSEDEVTVEVPKENFTCDDKGIGKTIKEELTGEVDSEENVIKQVLGGLIKKTVKILQREKRKQNADSYSSDDSTSEDEAKKEILHSILADEKKVVNEIPRVKNEVLLEELEDECEEVELTSQDHLNQIGVISGIVGKMIVVQSSKDAPALDADSAFFLQDRQFIGKVLDTFGPVKLPYYTLRLPSKLDPASVSVGTKVWFVPFNEEITKYVFLAQLKRMRGSDASWQNDCEPPPEHLEYSDDEDERRAKRELKQRRQDHGAPKTKEKDGQTCQSESSSNQDAARPERKRNGNSYTSNHRNQWNQQNFRGGPAHTNARDGTLIPTGKPRRASNFAPLEQQGSSQSQLVNNFSSGILPSPIRVVNDSNQNTNGLFRVTQQLAFAAPQAPLSIIPAQPTQQYLPQVINRLPANPNFSESNNNNLQTRPIYFPVGCQQSRPGMQIHSSGALPVNNPPAMQSLAFPRANSPQVLVLRGNSAQNASNGIIQNNVQPNMQRFPLTVNQNRVVLNPQVPASGFPQNVRPASSMGIRGPSPVPSLKYNNARLPTGNMGIRHPIPEPPPKNNSGVVKLNGFSFRI